MLKLNGIPVRIATMASGYHYRLRPLNAKLESGYEIFSRDSSVMNESQLKNTIKNYYKGGGR